LNWIYGSGYEFAKHPVLRLDMSRMATDSPEALKASLLAVLGDRSKGEGLDVAGSAPSDFFQFLIKGLHDKYGKRVAVLIDEYDKPILDRLNDLDTAEANRDVLRGFYGILLEMQPIRRFLSLRRKYQYAPVCSHQAFVFSSGKTYHKLQDISSGSRFLHQ